ncbi:MAG: hypothetical protein EXS32_14785 [Opitutus sp.]|nr:hypothetical protein [Opitutus sp.]
MKRRLLFLLVASLLTFVSCSKPPAAALAAAPAAKHGHQAPHGGTPVVLGQEAYHLELVRDATAGQLTAYVLDGEMENFVRVKTASFEVVARIGAEKRVLTFRATANSATGEKLGDTSCFEVQADWLKTEKNFDATLTSLEIKGTAFTAVAFNFPKGNDKD